MPHLEWDTTHFDFDRIIPFIQHSYWGKGRTEQDIRKAFQGSAVVGVFEGHDQLGMARAITDGVYHAYIYDLFVFEPYRGRGLSRILLQGMFQHPQLKDVKGWMLSTRDAHGLYEKYGFAPVDPQRVMWLRRT